MKVRESQIPESSGKPLFEGESKNDKKIPFEDFIKDDDELSIIKKKQLLVFEDFGISMKLSDVKNVHKTFRINIDYSPIPNPEYGIVLSYNVVLWFKNERLRDERWDKIFEILKENDYNVISL